jgi:serine/threonine-protein kinase RsbW
MEQEVTIRLDLPASYAQLNVLSGCIGELLARVEGIADRERVTFAVQLAAHEACTNIIDHAYGRMQGQRIAVSVSLALRPRRLVVELEDSGRPCDLDGIGEPNLSEPRESGYGMVLIRNLVDEVQYRRLAGGNRWRLVKVL